MRASSDTRDTIPPLLALWLARRKMEINPH